MATGGIERVEERYALAVEAQRRPLGLDLLTHIMYSPLAGSHVGLSRRRIGDKLEEWLDRYHDWIRNV